MNYKYTDGLKISEIILGTDYYGGIVDKKTAFSLYDKFVEYGGNCIDTAKLYEDGKSEEILGMWLRENKIKRDKIIISTKGAHPIGSPINPSRLSEREIEEDLDSSLKRLGVDCDENLKRYEKIRNIAGEYNVSLSSLVLSYIYSDKNINAFPIIGPKNMVQLDDCLEFTKVLNDKNIKWDAIL